MHLRNSIRARSASPSSHTPPGIAGQVLKTTVKAAEKALDGVAIPGVKSTVGALLELINALEVCTHSGLLRALGHDFHLFVL